MSNDYYLKSFFGCDWRDWSLSIGINFHPDEGAVIWLEFGPFACGIERIARMSTSDGL